MVPYPSLPKKTQKNNNAKKTKNKSKKPSTPNKPHPKYGYSSSFIVKTIQFLLISKLRKEEK